MRNQSERNQSSHTTSRSFTAIGTVILFHRMIGFYVLHITPLKFKTFQHHYWTDGETTDLQFKRLCLNRWWARVCWQSSVLKQSCTDISVFIVAARTSAAFKIELRKRFHLRNWPSKACMMHATALANEKILLKLTFWPQVHWICFQCSQGFKPVGRTNQPWVLWSLSQHLNGEGQFPCVPTGDQKTDAGSEMQVRVEGRGSECKQEAFANRWLVSAAWKFYHSYSCLMSYNKMCFL